VDAAAATAKFFAQFPGLADVMKPDHPGMHAGRPLRQFFE
jgi:hypothetical protein